MTFLVPKNERREARRRLVLPCRVVREHDFRLIGACAVDVSAGGMLVMAIGDVSLGDEVVLSFNATELGIAFDADAVVARVVHGRRQGDRGRCIGLHFRRLDAVKRLILRGHLRRMAPPLPQREARIDYAATVKRILDS
jgi:hypothetical protein